MKTLSEVVVMVGRIERTELVRWIELGWVAPSRPASVSSPAASSKEPDVLFSELDVARVRMICDLRRDLVVEEETMPLVLGLLDQMYALRHQLDALTGAIQQQPDQVRQAILERLRNRPDRPSERR